MEKDESVYTMSQIAAMTGVSKSTVSRILKRDRVRTASRTGQTNWYSDAALKAVRRELRDKRTTSTEKVRSGSEMVDILKNQLSEKDDQLNAKDDQINTKDEQIKGLQELLKQSQSMQQNLQSQVMQLQSPPHSNNGDNKAIEAETVEVETDKPKQPQTSNQSAPVPPKKKKHAWQFWK